jgi:hypothetical protein
MGILKRLRGLFGTALAWSAGWSLVGLALGALAWLTGAIPGFGLAALAGVVVRWAALGAAGGTGFAAILAIAERRVESVEELKVDRAARWGALGGAVLPIVLLGTFWAAHPGAFIFGVLFIPVGSGLAWGSARWSLRLAQRASVSAIQSARESPAHALPPAI